MEFDPSLHQNGLNFNAIASRQAHKSIGLMLLYGSGKLRDHQGDKRPFSVICPGFLHLAKSNSTKLPPTDPALGAN